LYSCCCANYAANENYHQALIGHGHGAGAAAVAGQFLGLAKIREQADVVEAQAIFHAGELAEQRIDSTKELSEARIMVCIC
jgi:hypothetical protein